MASGLYALVLAGVACSDDVSYVVVTPQPAGGEAPFELIEQYRVLVDNMGEQTALYYPKTPGAPFTVGPGPGPNFSVSFPEARAGSLVVSVFPRKAGGTEVGWGTAAAPIQQGGVARVVVSLMHGTPPDGGATDGGTGDGGGDGKADGPKACSPAMPATCGPSMTCYLSCDTKTGLCSPAGSQPVAGACKGTSDCSPGTSCFNYDTCSVKACGRYCDTDADCPGGKCFGDLTCGGSTALGRLCSFACDPRPAGGAKIGCPAGLLCGIYQDETPDCQCPESTGTGGDGDTCADSSACKPGFHCIEMGGPKTCRQICKLGDGGDCPSGTSCIMLTNYKTFGACL